MADKELEKIQELCIAKIYLCADNVIKYLENDKITELEKLRSRVKHYCLYEQYPDIIAQVSEKIKNELDSSNVNEIEKRFNTYFNALVDESNVKNHPWMVELNKRINLNNRIAENLDNSDLVLTNTNEVFNDPITKKHIQDPVKNIHCGHIYERESILNYIKSRKHKTLCPVASCGNKNQLLQEHLVTAINTRCTNTIQSTLNEVSVCDVDMESESE